MRSIRTTGGEDVTLDGDLLAVLQIQLPDENREALEALFRKTEV